jgi:hypothetical protein
MYLAGNLVQPQAFAAFTTPGMTCQIMILDDSSNLYVSTQNLKDGDSHWQSYDN